MDTTLARLKDWGCDIDGALARTLGDEELLLYCIQQVAIDPAYQQLGQALDAGDVKAAFDAAHTLKGILGNTGVTPLYDIDVQIVEPLRAGHTDGTQDAYRDLMDQLAELKRQLG